jgi:chemotaxis protein MotB
MKYTTRLLIPMAFLISISTGHAQSKKELIAEIDNLKSELSSTKSELAETRKNEAMSSARVAAIETQFTELRETNTNLLNNLNRITEESSKKTASISESLTNIQRTERQLRMISDGLTKVDSTTLGIVTDLKQTLGENAKIGISNNVVTIAIENSALFGADNSYAVDGASTETLSKIADLLKKYPNTILEIDSYANALEFSKTAAPADNLELSALRAVALARLLKESHGIGEQRIVATGKGIEGMSVETSTRFQLRPDYETFYRGLKENIKN